MGGGAGVIRTPDQRLRVFVSSTLRELAAERRVIRAVIERLALAPVMFELGARPHPPRSLYRAYLEQSDIFIGVYWESYGWVAPGEKVSGLEDEYNLAPNVPMLIYVKRSEQRQDRLDSLLDRIRSDDRASYVAFDDAEELGPLITSDLATLLAERFDEGRRRRPGPLDVAPAVASSQFLRPPTPLTRLMGRETEVQRVVDLLTTEKHRLVTVTGPGGIGKSRVAIAAARDAELSFPDGIAFVDLAPIQDPDLVVSTIATALGIRDTGDEPLLAKVTRALDRRRVLLVLDNVEQVVDAAAELSALLGRGSVSMLATSRIPLRIDGEQNLPVAPLPSAVAIELFVERARAVKPEFELTDANTADVTAIVATLDSVPLALELAAARLRVLTPAALSERLGRALPVLVGGARDRPERQRTLRATIDWSAQLLRDPERDLLLRLSVFRTGFALDAAEWMCEGTDAEDAVDLLATLVESSLVQEQDRGFGPWFSMLATVREYARDGLERRGALQTCEQRHAEFYTELAALAEPHLLGAEQSTWLARLQDEFEDMRAAVEHYLAMEHGDAAAELVWPLYWFWWITGRIPEVRDWIANLADNDDLSDLTRARAKFYVAGAATWTQTDPSRIPDMLDCLAYFLREHDLFGEFLARVNIAISELFRGAPGVEAADHQLLRAQAIAEEVHSPSLLAMVLVTRGQTFSIRGDVPKAKETFEAALDAAKSTGEAVLQYSALYQLGWVQMRLGNHSTAQDYFVQELLMSSAIGHEEGIAYGLEGLFAVSAVAGDVRRAGRLLGAAEDTRARKGLLGPGWFSYHLQILAQIEATPAADEFTIAREQGRRADIAEVVEEALT